MTDLILTKYVHYLAVFAIVGAIFSEQFLVSRTMSRSEIKRIARIDAIYGIGAILALIAGITLWIWVGKPASFYSRNWIFHSKLTLFLVMAIASVFPTVFYLKHKKGNDLETQIDVPFYVILLLRLEMLIILLIPLLASFATVGIGTF